VDGADTGMVQRAGRSRLALEAFESGGVTDQVRRAVTLPHAGTPTTRTAGSVLRRHVALRAGARGRDYRLPEPAALRLQVWRMVSRER
jgi:hypothetical protein